MSLPKPLVYTRFRPAWTYSDGIRTFCSFFCERTFEDSAIAERASMVMQELLENAVKYSLRGDDQELELALDAREGELNISITSAPDPAHAEILMQSLAELYEKSAEQAYLDAFARVGDPDSTGSRIGLARIRHEGHLDLSARYVDGGRLMVEAEGKL